MNNVISFKDAIERRKKKNEKSHNFQKIKSSSSESSFIEEAKRFKFRLSKPIVSFVLINTENLPEPFPPNPLPPMVA